jgi:hypothetical protein
MVEDGESGAFNATSPDGMHSRFQRQPRAERRARLGRRGVSARAGRGALARPTALIPAGDDEMAYFHRTDVSKAVAAGLTFRPLEETARAVPEWNGAAGISPEHEAELLGEWAKVAA